MPEMKSWDSCGGKLTGNHEVSPENRHERHFFSPALLFFPGPQESNQRFCWPRGMILKHFAPKNDEIGCLEASGAHSGVGKDPVLVLSRLLALSTVGVLL